MGERIIWELPKTESELHEAIQGAMVRENYEYAALCSLALADRLAARVGSDAAQVCMAQAQVLATLQQQKMALFIAEGRQPFVPGAY